MVMSLGGMCVCYDCRTVLYRSVDDATAVPMAMNGEHLDWASAEGQKLAQVMLHSPNEINFSIGRPP